MLTNKEWHVAPAALDGSRCTAKRHATDNVSAGTKRGRRKEDKSEQPSQLLGPEAIYSEIIAIGFSKGRNWENLRCLDQVNWIIRSPILSAICFQIFIAHLLFFI